MCGNCIEGWCLNKRSVSLIGLVLTCKDWYLLLSWCSVVGIGVSSGWCSVAGIGVSSGWCSQIIYEWIGLSSRLVPTNCGHWCLKYPK